MHSTQKSLFCMSRIKANYFRCPIPSWTEDYVGVQDTTNCD